MFENIHPKRRWQSGEYALFYDVVSSASQFPFYLSLLSGEWQMVANIHLRIDFTRFWKEVENFWIGEHLLIHNLVSFRSEVLSMMNNIQKGCDRTRKN